MTDLTNRTRPTDNQTRNWEGARYHVIYMTEDGRDYCRETTLAKTYKAAVDKAQAMFNSIADSHARRAVKAFRVECW